MKRILIVLPLFCALSVFAVDPKLSPETEAQLRAVARTYLKSQLVNPEPWVAPTQCFMPATAALLSEAKASSPHGGKLYYLFARDRKPLVHKAESKAQPVGQFLVKESWVADTVTDDKPQSVYKHASGKSLSGRAWHEGKTLQVGDPLDLFIMLKQDPKTPHTDDGWVYAVVSRDGHTISHAGQIQSCIDCHQDAKHDRILGVYAPDQSMIEGLQRHRE